MKNVFFNQEGFETSTFGRKNRKAQRTVARLLSLAKRNNVPAEKREDGFGIYVQFKNVFPKVDFGIGSPRSEKSIFLEKVQAIIDNNKPSN